MTKRPSIAIFVATLCVGLGLPALLPASAESSGETLGFVISKWGDRVPATKPEDCPEGMNLTEDEHYKVDMKAFRADIKKLGYRPAVEKYFPPDACQDPTAQEDPGFKTFQASVPVAGLDLDGKDSKQDDGGGCAHNDFTSPTGERGIDNQHWRLMGCTKGYQLDGLIDRQYKSNNFVKEGYPVLIQVSGVDDRTNDDDVQVQIFSSEDSVTLDAAGNVIPDLSMRVHKEKKYWGPPAKGQIKDGVLTSEPVDLKLRFKQQVIDDAFYYRDARIKAKINPDGRIEGIIGYYWDTENFYRINNDHYIGKNHTGRIAALTRGYMCAGIYHAIPRMADGHPDPETGACTSISTALHFEAKPAFVIRPTLALSQDR